MRRQVSENRHRTAAPNSEYKFHPSLPDRCRYGAGVGGGGVSSSSTQAKGAEQRFQPLSTQGKLSLEFELGPVNGLIKTNEGNHYRSGEHNKINGLLKSHSQWFRMSSKITRKKKQKLKNKQEKVAQSQEERHSTEIYPETPQMLEVNR